MDLFYAAVNWLAKHPGEVCLVWMVADKAAKWSPWTKDDEIVGLARTIIKRLIGRDPAKG